MKRIAPLLIGLALFAAPLAAAPQPPADKGAKPAAPPALPKPDPEMAQLKWFVGTWSCKGHVEASPFGPAHDTTGTVKMTMDLGFWVTGHYAESKTKENAMPMRFEFVWGRDGKDKKFDSWGFDVFGAATKQESTGWDGDKMVWSGESTMGAQQMGARDTFVKKGDSEVIHTGEMQMEGKWMKIDEETCTKAAAKK